MLEKTILPPVFVGQQLHKQYKKGGFQLFPIDITLQLGQITGVVGENGNGKSTLIKLIAGEEQATSGSLSYPLFGANDWATIKSEIAYIPQRLHKWNGDVQDYLKFTAAAKGIFGEENKKAVDYIINRLGLSNYANYDWNELSGGYQMRFELARMLVWKPKFLLLDEPLAHLDINAQAIFLRDLAELSKDPTHPFAVMITSQHLYEVESISENVLFLRNGKTVYNGAIADFDTNRLTNTYELSSTVSNSELMKLLETIGCQSVEDKGNSIIVQVDIAVDSTAFMKLVFEQGIEIKYFRNISQSTRKLF